VHIHSFSWWLLFCGVGPLLVLRCRCSFKRKGMQIAYQGLNVVVRLLPRALGRAGSRVLAVACAGACYGRPHYSSLRMCNYSLVGLLLVACLLDGKVSSFSRKRNVFCSLSRTVCLVEWGCYRIISLCIWCSLRSPVQRVFKSIQRQVCPQLIAECNLQSGCVWQRANVGKRESQCDVALSLWLVRGAALLHAPTVTKTCIIHGSPMISS